VGPAGKGAAFEVVLSPSSPLMVLVPFVGPPALLDDAQDFLFWTLRRGGSVVENEFATAIGSPRPLGDEARSGLEVGPPPPSGESEPVGDSGRVLQHARSRRRRRICSLGCLRASGYFEMLCSFAIARSRADRHGFQGVAGRRRAMRTTESEPASDADLRKSKQGETRNG